MTVILPGLAEPNMGQADRAPSKQGSKSRQRNEPIEDHSSTSAEIDVSQKTTNNNDSNRERGSASSVNISEYFRGVAKLGHSCKRTRTTVNSGHTDRQDGYGDDNIDEVVEAV